MLSRASPRIIEIEANLKEWAMFEKVDGGKGDSLRHRSSPPRPEG
jgi:hypothetical protein